MPSPDEPEHEHGLSQTGPIQVVMQQAGDLRDRKDEDQIEEQLHEGDALIFRRIRSKLPLRSPCPRVPPLHDVSIRLPYSSIRA